MSILITGGAGYIGSHMAYALVDRGEDVVVLDNLSTGFRHLVPERARFIAGDAGDAALVGGLLREHAVSAVIHFAGSLVAPESVDQPLAYYANNIAASRNLIETCVRGGVRNFVFSSTAAVYGAPKTNPVNEDAPAAPINPYGRSKLMTEWVLEDTAHAHNFRYVALRYFNVAGADAKGRTGQSAARATHLIKRACQVALGRLDRLDVFGTDFPTRDGTGVRDYIHVSDLIGAHVLALDHLAAGGGCEILNCGYGHGFSVREVAEAVSRVSGRPVPMREAPRRVGDSPELVADPSQLKARFSWRPEHDDLADILASALAWERRLPA